MTSPASTSQSPSPSHQLTVVDVYDLAAAIGKDFESLIDAHGPDTLREIMPKVISALEMLEAFAGANERDNEQVIQLSKDLERLEHSRSAAASARDRFELEIEHLEEQHRGEIDKLQAQVKKLQQENRRLMRQHESDGSDGNAYNSPIVSDDENGIVQRLQTALKESRDTLAAVRHELEESEKAARKTSDEAEKYRRQAEEAQRQCTTMRHQGRLLVEERAQLQSQLQHIEEELIETRHRLGQTERAMIDSEQLKNETTDDKADRPRFTLAELRHVLNERNELKARVLQLEEQIENMQAATNKPPVKDEELVVYGPLPREPEEKLHPWKYRRQQSGVRKLFSRVWRSATTVTVERVEDAADDTDGTFELAEEPAISAICSSRATTNSRLNSDERNPVEVQATDAK